MPNFTLEGHEKGVNCVDYFTGVPCSTNLCTGPCHAHVPSGMQ